MNHGEKKARCSFSAGWNDVSFHGSNQISTPNLDVLASEGIILHNYYTMQLCTPSRAALLSGLYPIRTGMQSGIIGNSEPWGLPLNLKLIPEHFKDLGYEVHMIGKVRSFNKLGCVP